VLVVNRKMKRIKGKKELRNTYRKMKDVTKGRAIMKGNKKEKE
jgi:hypothetical protein